MYPFSQSTSRLRRLLPFALLMGAATAAWAAGARTLPISYRGINGPAVTGAGGSLPALSGDGRYVAFISEATNWSTRANGKLQVYVRDRQSGITELVSIGADGKAGNQNSHEVTMSSDGRYVVFASFATNLVKRSGNGMKQIYLRDRQKDRTELISFGPSGAGNVHSGYSFRVSDDGRYVAFESRASNLVPGDQNGFSDAFVRDRTAGTIERVSVGASGAEANGESPLYYGLDMTPDGRFVAFASTASNLVSGDTNGTLDIFVRDRTQLTTERISLTSDEGQLSDGSSEPAVSADGRFVAFNTWAPELNGLRVVVRDRQAGTTEGVDAHPVIGMGRNASAPDISADGRYVFFGADASLVSDSRSGWDYFRRDRSDGSLEWASVPQDPQLLVGDDYPLAKPVISGNGRFGAFVWRGNDLVAGDTNGEADVFVRDFQADKTERASLGTGDRQGVAPATGTVPVISSNGQWVAFVSDATNLVHGDTNQAPDVFVWSRLTGKIERVSLNSAGGEGDESSGCWDRLLQSPSAPSISRDGRYVAFISNATNLVANDTNGKPDLFVHDRNTGITERVSLTSSGQQLPFGLDPYFATGLSADGRFALFATGATGVTPDEPLFSFTLDLFVRDRVLGTTERVTVPAGGGQLNGFIAPSEGGISGDGRYVVFSSNATNLVPGDTNNHQDIFVRDLQLDVTERVNVGAGGAEANHWSQSPSISEDGRYVGFSSNATNLVAGDPSGDANVFLRDREAGTTEQIDRASNNGQPNGFSLYPSVSAEGRYVAFLSWASNLVKKDTNQFPDLFLRDRQSGSTSRINVAGSSGQLKPPFALGITSRVVSASGRHVVFVSDSPQLFPRKAKPGPTVFLRDRGTRR